MKTIDLRKGQHLLSEVLALTKSEAVLIHSVSAEDFVLEHADDFAALGASAKLSSFLSGWSKELRTSRSKKYLGSVACDRARDRRTRGCICPGLHRDSS